MAQTQGRKGRPDNASRAKRRRDENIAKLVNIMTERPSEPLAVKYFEQATGLSQSCVYRHLNTLVDNGIAILVDDGGKAQLYSLAPDRLRLARLRQAAAHARTVRSQRIAEAKRAENATGHATPVEAGTTQVTRAEQQPATNGEHFSRNGTTYDMSGAYSTAFQRAIEAGDTFRDAAVAAGGKLQEYVEASSASTSTAPTSNALQQGSRVEITRRLTKIYEQLEALQARIDELEAEAAACAQQLAKH